MNNDKTLEHAIQAAGANVAPRITPADLEANIVREFTFTAGSAVPKDLPFGAGCCQALDLLTICVLVLRNGFTVTGESACASPENFNAEIGRKAARDHAVNKMWPLMGYELKERLYQRTLPPVAPTAPPPTTFRERMLIEKAELDEKMNKLGDFMKTIGFTTLPGPEQTDLRDQHVAMQDYSFLLGRRLLRSAPAAA